MVAGALIGLTSGEVACRGLARPAPVGHPVTARLGPPVARRLPARLVPKDVVAGLVLSALLVPQGMAYAELAGLPAVTGLYTSILCLIGYALVGPSRILVLGPDSSLGPMIAATILPLVGADGDPAKAVVLASMLAILTGAMMLAAGAGHLGFVADLLSKPTILGYMNGLALTILVGQLPKLLGFSVDADGFIGELLGFVQGVVDGEVVLASAAIGLLSLAIMLVLGRVLPKVPAVLVAVVAAIVLSIALSLADRGVAVVGPLEQGMPQFTFPSVGFKDLSLLVLGALGISLVALADTISTATSFADRQGTGGRQPGDDRHRHGQHRRGPVPGLPGEHQRVAHRGGGEGRITHPAHRTRRRRDDRADADRVPVPARRAAAAHPGRGGHRRLDLPRGPARDATPVRPAARGLPAVHLGLPRRRAARRPPGHRHRDRPVGGQRLPTHLVALPHDPGPRRRNPRPARRDAATPRRRLEGCVVLRFDAPLIFANAGTFRDEVLALAGAEPRPRWIIVAAEPITDVDTTACDMLEELVEKLDARSVHLVFAELKDPARRKIDRYGLEHVLGDERFYPTITAATDAFRRDTGAGWVRPSGEG